MRNLRSLTLNRFVLQGVDAEFDYLLEGSFSRQMPENILNFVNLKKLRLLEITELISLDEQFLEDLVNLEDLELNRVFSSIDSDVQFLFKSLTKLKRLTLRNNSVNTVKASYFDFLIDLEEMDLRKNEIKVIEFGSFKNLKKVKCINLMENAFFLLLFHTVQQSRDGHSESRRTPYAEQCRLFKINWKKINKKFKK